ncbi:MAG: hypothetical protein GYB33_10440 [Gammaproteobacteria bacterium]|uniref:hypothetical protein n=1 Tax=Pseudomaricurvus alcaniphilus TaxID=1166482 RepID=UPI00140BF7F3|nr:hypothetical protein [Pseudomaricurvus alcaniphilus]MBR9910753.1 hypothetical protein [Gammaproteobacteria bacterium]NHN39092.1 hypothetical protein [Pseudomaricurvus alcaniphilus]
MPLQTVLQLLRTPLFLASLTALITLLLSASIFQTQQSSLLDKRNNHYGNALASLAARQATDATLNHDLVSLQVTVRDVARNPHVLSTTIHDVENQLLVQAGSNAISRGFLPEQTRSYSAPITFQDSIAGYVTVTLDTQALYEQRDNAWLLGLVGLCLALLALSTLNLRKKPEPSPAAANSATEAAADSDADIALPGRNQTGEGAIFIALKLHCLNMPALERQLSASLRQQLVADMERYLSGINTIYSGRIHAADNRDIELHFQGDDLENTVFRAICAAQLLFRLLDGRRDGIPLHYAAAVFALQRSSQLSVRLQQSALQRQCQQALQQQVRGGLLVHAGECSTSPLLQRLQCQDHLLDDTWLQVSGLQSGYAGLLDKQAQQLNPPD